VLSRVATAVAINKKSDARKKRSAGRATAAGVVRELAIKTSS